MAKFLNTKGISYHLQELIKGTKERLILISPYLQLSETIKGLISGLNEKKRDIWFIYRENKLRSEDNKWLEKQLGVRTRVCDNLHAKCYLNENAAIITSMNLCEFSQLDNFEMGMHITKLDDPGPYYSTFTEAQRLLDIARENKVSAPRSSSSNQKKNNDKKNSENLQHHASLELPLGYCIRTGVPIPFNLDKPFCKDIFTRMTEFTDFAQPEKFCHFSGDPSYGETTMIKPILLKYWKQASDLHHLV